MSKKRAREAPNVDVTLVEIWEDLANEDEGVRLKAAHRLVSNFCDTATTSSQQIKVIVTRLFRGLCSGRKAARLGFSIGLAAYLSKLHRTDTHVNDHPISLTDILDILERSTIPEGNSSGQEERDHYFGRLFGAEAIINANIFTQENSLVYWKRLLEIICGIAEKKPWLRQECGWILFTWTNSSQVDSSQKTHALAILDALNNHNMIRSPEGVALWLKIAQKFPDAKLPKNVWKHRDPLSSKELPTLAQVLKDSKPQAKPTADSHEAQGSAIWSSQLHFVWDIIFRQFNLFDPLLSVKGKLSHHQDVYFASFWIKVVDDGLLKPSGSTERKHWGLLVLDKALAEICADDLSPVLTPNAMKCLFESLKMKDRYLHRTAQKVLATIRTRASEGWFTAACYVALVEAANFDDFDTATKSKTLETLAVSAPYETKVKIFGNIKELFQDPGTNDQTEVSIRRKKLSNLQAKLLSQVLSNLILTPNNSDPSKGGNEKFALDVLSHWIEVAICRPDMAAREGFRNQSPIPPKDRSVFEGMLSRGFEQALRCGAEGRKIVRSAIAYIRCCYERLRDPPSDAKVVKIVEQGWTHLSCIPYSWLHTETITTPGKFRSIYGYRHELSDSSSQKKGKRMHPENGIGNGIESSTSGSSYTEGLALLFSLTLFQVHIGDAEAVEILDDLVSYQERHETKSKGGKKENLDETDALVEIILSFASRQSKFLRRITQQIFEALAPQITSKGLQSFVRILETAESVHGQQEMFEAGDVYVESDEEYGMELDSDVEVVDSDEDGESDDESSSEASDSLSDETDETDEDRDKAEELAAFDAKLAAALGTRKISGDNQSGSSESSDSDMDDEEMFALDEKLQEVFRTREHTTSKKKESKDAKENIINFKNRVLDFVDSYLKHQYLSPQSLCLVLPLLKLARKTNTKQLADRACSILRDFCGRCKGTNVPALPSNEDDKILEALQLLKDIHDEAGLEGSNARAAACSSASILAVKILLNAKVDVELVLDVYGATRKRQLMDKKCKVQPAFFTEWNNWCAQARNQLAR